MIDNFETGILIGHTIGDGFEEDWSFVNFCLDDEQLYEIYLNIRKDPRLITYIKKVPELQPILDMPDFAVRLMAAKQIDEALE